MNTIKAAKLTRDVNSFVRYGVTPARSRVGRGMSHIKWMLEEIIKGEMGDMKANRWLGYAQGAMVFMKLVNLEKMKEINSRSIEDDES